MPIRQVGKLTQINGWIQRSDNKRWLLQNKRGLFWKKRHLLEVKCRLFHSLCYIIDIKWNMHRRILFDATIRVSGIDRIGLLNEVTGILSQQLNVNIQKLTISTKDGVFDGTIELKVYDRNDVKIIIDALSNIQNLEEIKEIQ